MLIHIQLNIRRMREGIIEPNIKYSRIGERRRTKLIDLVIHQGYKTVRASKMLKINQSTAKSILKLYRETGTYTLKPKSNQEALNRPKNTQTIQTQQQRNIDGNNQIDQDREAPAEIEHFQENLNQLYFCEFPIYYLIFYVVFPNSWGKE